MKTRYGEDQQALAEAFAALFERESPVEVVRSAEAGCGFDKRLWHKLADSGASGMAVSPTMGGGGASLADLAVVAYEWGRRIAPAPLIEHAVACRLLAAATSAPGESGQGAGERCESAQAESSQGEPAQAEPELNKSRHGAGAGDSNRLLIEELAVGAMIGTVALRPPDVSGTARLVPAGAVADVVVALREGEFSGHSEIVIQRGSPPGLARSNTAGLPLADRDVSDAQVVASGATARRSWDQALAEWKALMAVAYAGLGRQALDMGVDYVKQRYQFGMPVGSFQAVQHGLADAATRLEGARLLAFRAVCALDASAQTAPHLASTARDDSAAGADMTPGAQNAPRLASMALLFAAGAARFVTDRALHYHGGYGYSAEYDIQLYYRRAAAWLLQLGEPAAEISRLAHTELGPKEQAA